MTASSDSDISRTVYCVLGLPVDAVDIAGAVERVRHAAFSNTRCFISTPNLNFVTLAWRDADFRDSVLQSNLCLADGMPLVWVSRLLGLPIRRRVSGADLFESLQSHPGPRVTIYFFGGPEGAAKAAGDYVNRVAGGLRCVGFESPGYGSVQELSDGAHIERINRSGAQFVIVALGAKKGQQWIAQNRHRLHAPVVCHLGAVVNFVAGIVRRAPRWVRALGFEWLWRIQEEPALWRRYRSDGLSLVPVLIRQTLPLALRLRLGSGSAAAQVSGSVSVVETPAEVTIHLRGAWGRQGLAPLRVALSNAVRSAARAVVLDFDEVTQVDAAVLGTLLLARGSLAAPRTLSLRNVSLAVEHTFQQHCAGFLTGRPA